MAVGSALLDSRDAIDELLGESEARRNHVSVVFVDVTEVSFGFGDRDQPFTKSAFEFLEPGGGRSRSRIAARVCAGFQPFTERSAPRAPALFSTKHSSLEYAS